MGRATGQGRAGLGWKTKSRWAAGIYGKLRQEYNGWRHPADFVPAVSDEVGPRRGNQQPSGLQCVLLVISSLTFVTFMTFKLRRPGIVVRLGKRYYEPGKSGQG